MKKRLANLALAAVITTAAITACSDNGGNANSTASPGESTAAPSAQQAEIAEAIREGTYRFDPPVTITTVKATDSTMKFKNGETFENNVHTKWAKEELGIDIRLLWQSPGDQFNTKIRLMLTANEDLPDVLMTEDMSLLDELIQSGKYKDITADFEAYASDKMKQIYNSSPLNWSQVTYGDKKMAIPNFANAGNDNAVMWVRQDWLDELGMTAPTTFEELEALMQAFLDKKPGGSDNIIPLGASLGAGGSSPNPFANWLGETTWVFGAYGTIPYQWLEQDGQLVHGSTLPAMKDGLIKLKDWYEKGYLSKEAGLHDENKLAELISQGRIGIVFAPNWLYNWPVPDLEKNVPGATMKPYPLPTLNGKVAAKDTTYLRGGMLVKEGFKHTDALFLYLNRLGEGVNASNGMHATGEFELGWAEDYDYTIKADGTYSREDKDIPGGKVDVFKYFLMQVKDPFVSLKLGADIGRGKEPETDNERRTAEGNPDSLLSAVIVDDGWNAGLYIPNVFSGANTPSMQSKNGILTKLEGDTFLSIIYNKKPVDEFDNFVKEWYNLGGDAITKEVNEWYQKMK